jgi:hypothetical protein
MALRRNGLDDPFDGILAHGRRGLDAIQDMRSVLGKIAESLEGTEGKNVGKT